MTTTTSTLAFDLSKTLTAGEQAIPSSANQGQLWGNSYRHASNEVLERWTDQRSDGVTTRPASPLYKKETRGGTISERAETRHQPILQEKRRSGKAGSTILSEDVEVAIATTVKINGRIFSTLRLTDDMSSVRLEELQFQELTVLENRTRA